MAASVPTTQYWAVVRVWAQRSAQWGCSFLRDLPECSRPWTPSRVSVFLGEEKWGTPHVPPCVEAPLVTFTCVAM